MSDRLTIVPRPISPPVPPGGTRTGRTGQTTGPGFEALLRSHLEPAGVKFSRHASERLQQRGIQVSPDQQARLDQAINQVENKGGRDSLVLLDNLAMVVSVKNQTVVTVVETNRLQDNIFTNIDSAVIA